MYVFTNGLTDTKVGEMRFFNGNLYMLFDNSQVIRAFAPNGIMLNEWGCLSALPSLISSEKVCTWTRMEMSFILYGR